MSAIETAEGVAIGIPFSLNWTNVVSAMDVDAKTVSSSSDQSVHRRTVALSNAGFVMELATDSICSFSSDLISDGNLCYDSHTPYHGVVAVPDVLVTRGEALYDLPIIDHSKKHAWFTRRYASYEDEIHGPWTRVMGQ